MAYPIELSFLGSSLGIVGFAIGAVGFLSSQIPRLVLQSHEYTECAERMEFFREVYQSCHRDLKKWEALWSDKSYSSEDYFQLWSPEDHSTIKKIESRIKKLSKKIYHDLVAPQDAWWQANVVSLSQGLQVDEKHDVNLFDRVVFVLYRNASLLDKTQRLGKVIEGLLKVSKEYFNQNHRTKVGDDITPEEITRIVRGTIFVTNLRYFADKLHYHRRKSDFWETCALEIGPINGNTEVEPDIWAGCPIDFRLTMVRSEGETGQSTTFKRVQIVFTSDTLKINKSLMDHGASVFSSGTRSLDTSFWLVEETAVERSKPFSKLLERGRLRDERLYRAWARDRASLALAFATWMTLLWRAPWTSPPCCCGIRLQKVFKKGNNTPQLCHTFTCEDKHDCKKLEQQPQIQPPSTDRSPSAEPSKRHRYLLFIGLTLAELVLASRLRIKIRTPDAVHFDYDWEMQTSQQEWKQMSTSEILLEVRKRSLFDGIANAIKYCLNDKSTASIESFAGGTFHEICREVLEPLRKYQRAILEDDSRFWNNGWLRKLATQWPPKDFFEEPVEIAHASTDNNNISTGTDIRVPGMFPNTLV